MCNSSSSKKSAPSRGGGGGGINDNGTLSIWLLRLVLTTLFLLYTLGFTFFRLPEILPSYALYSHHWKSALLGTLALHFTLANNSRRDRFLLHCASMALLVHILDHHILNPLPAAVNDESGTYSNLRVVVTGANAGVGYETSRRLAVEYGVQVIMGCRSENKCRVAAESIREEIVTAGSIGSVTPSIIDLSDLESVKSFADQLQLNNSDGQDNNKRIDVLFNNAGYAPPRNLPINQYGLDPSFTSMHLAHFYLTELLIQTNNPELRVVNTASVSHHLCAMPFAFLPSSSIEYIPKMILPHSRGCIDEEYLEGGIRSPTTMGAYIEAKMTNVLHIVELNRRHEKVMGVAIDLGWVGTKIQPWMEIGLSPTNIGWMRHASIGVVPILHAILSTNEELAESSKTVDSDNTNSKNKKSVEIMNVLGHTEQAFTKRWWNEDSDLGRERMVEISGMLWEESGKILRANGYDV